MTTISVNPAAHEAAHEAALEARKPTADQRYTVTTHSCDGHSYTFTGLSFSATREKVDTLLSLMALGDCDGTNGFSVTPVTPPTGHDH